MVLKRLTILLLISIIFFCNGDDSQLVWDESGYIVYCPCMGRLGNQVEQFLGALKFAKNLNRTLVVPPWIAYDIGADTSFTPYDTWFDFEELKKFHKVVMMRHFMEQLAPTYWPNDGKSRKVYCPSGAAQRSPDLKSCPAKVGSPFGPFWDSFNVDFTGGSELFPPGLSYGDPGEKWDSKFPPQHHPVLAFMGAPGAFPVKKGNRGIQKYVKWSKKVVTQAEEFIAKKLQRPFLGIHLRNGPDWVRACEHVDDHHNHQFMGSQQCLGYESKSAHKLTHEMCLPSKDAIIGKVKEVCDLHDISHLYIATDENPMLKDFSQLSLKATKYDVDSPILDLAILTMADVFIGNCISTFTSFVVRQREVEGKKNYFFGFDHEHVKIVHDDL